MGHYYGETSAHLLRRAAAAMRADAEREATLRKGDPYWAAEASVFEKRMTPTAALAIADWLDVFARYPLDGGGEDDERAAAEAVARAYLGET